MCGSQCDRGDGTKCGRILHQQHQTSDEETGSLGRLAGAKWCQEEGNEENMEHILVDGTGSETSGRGRKTQVQWGCVLFCQDVLGTGESALSAD